MTSIADKLGIGNEVRELRLGASFTSNGNSAFHSVRYDFKPASVDATKVATVDIGEGHQVAVTVPHIEGSGTAHTVFKGSKKPYQKECVLIIDRTTGEITLEKLSYNIQLKKTRAEGSSRIQPRPITPIEHGGSSGAKRFSPSSSQQKCSPTSSQKPPHSPNQKVPWPTANHSSPSQSKTSPHQKATTSPNRHRSPPNQPSPSMPCLVPPAGAAGGGPVAKGGANREPVMPMLPLVNSAGKNEAPDIGVLTDSSDSSDSSSSGGSSGSESSESESEAEEEAAVPQASSRPQGAANGGGPQYTQPNTAPMLSMPRFSTLSEDLQLSESGSDSDS